MLIGIFNRRLMRLIHALCAVSFAQQKVYAGVPIHACVFDVTLSVWIAVDAGRDKVVFCHFHPNRAARPAPLIVVNAVKNLGVFAINRLNIGMIVSSVAINIVGFAALDIDHSRLFVGGEDRVHSVEPVEVRNAHRNLWRGDHLFFFIKVVQLIHIFASDVCLVLHYWIRKNAAEQAARKKSYKKVDGKKLLHNCIMRNF